MDRVTEPIPKPWEEGYSADRLPKQKLLRKPAGSGLSEAQKLKRNEQLKKNFKGRNVNDLSAEEKKESRKKGGLAIKAKAKARKEEKRLISAEQLLMKKNFDPMDFLIDAAQGNALYEDHPFLPKLHAYLADIMERIEYQDGFGVKGLLDQLRIESISYLHDSYTPKDLRINVAKELMQYTRPKLKQTEHITKNEDSGVATPLTEEEVKMFKEWFDNEF